MRFGLLGMQVRYLMNVSPNIRTVTVPDAARKRDVLHPVHQAAGAAYRQTRVARVDIEYGRLSVPARTVVVFALVDRYGTAFRSLQAS